MFSRTKVLELEAIVQEKAAKVCRRMQEGIDQGKPVDLHHAFRSVSVDVISDFAFDRCYDFLDKGDIGATFFEYEACPLCMTFYANRSQDGSRHRSCHVGVPTVPIVPEHGPQYSSMDGTLPFHSIEVRYWNANGVRPSD